MRKFLTLSAVIMLTIFANSANAAVVSKDITYKDGDVTLKGTLAYDDSLSGMRPGVLLIPEWWGDNDYIKHRTAEMAKDGYIAFAIDMYGDGKSTLDPKEATGWTKAFYDDRNLMRTRARAGLNVLKQQAMVDKNKIAIIGFCFGGTTALELARSGEDVKGVAVFHAGLQFPDKVESGKVKAKVLVMNGGADSFVPAADSQKFITDMEAAGADYQYVEYSGAKHAFTNPDADKISKSANLPGIGYNQKAEERSFKLLKSFFSEIFG